MTKREMYNFIATIAANTDDEFIAKVAEACEVEAVKSDIVDFCEKEVSLIDNRNEKAKVRVANKRAADTTTDAIMAVIAAAEGEPVTIADILAAMPEDAEMTPNKVAPRAKKLIEAGSVEKVEVSVTGEDGKARKAVAYKLVG